jgi:alginate O-acetyltransferase complex protein AlgI
MLFQSIDYGVFFIIVFTLYWCSNHKLQNIILLISSYFFYSYVNIWFFWLIFFQSFISFQSAKLIPKIKYQKWLAPFFAISINLFILGYFKYYNFFVDNIVTLLESFQINTSFDTLKILLPVGISFYTFQNIGYVVDVYRKKIEPCHNSISYFVFVSFFPQLVAGPIERASNLLPQIEKKRTFSMPLFVDGFFLISWGLFKKLVIADNVALICNKIYLLNNPDPYLIFVGTLAFCIQIFADFSAYTDIARGSAKLLGFNLIQNFNNPYFSRNPSEFWQRWHISLSGWIRDYLYIPLGGSRCSKTRWVVNIFLTFFLMGLWHGASMNFIIWGLYHASISVIYKVWENIIPKKIYDIKYNAILSIPIFFFFTNIGWMIFREQDLGYLIKYFSLFFVESNALNFNISLYLMLNLFVYSLPLIFTSTFAFITENKINEKQKNESLRIFSKTFGSLIFFFGILSFRSSTAIDFIYFQF